MDKLSIFEFFTKTSKQLKTLRITFELQSKLFNNQINLSNLLPKLVCSCLTACAVAGVVVIVEAILLTLPVFAVNLILFFYIFLSLFFYQFF